MAMLRINCLVIYLPANFKEQYFRCWAECVATHVFGEDNSVSLHLTHDFILSVDG